jgi:pyruvate carboxylase
MSIWPSSWKRPARTCIGIKDMAGLLKPAAAHSAVQGAARCHRPAAAPSTPTIRPAFRRVGAGRRRSGVDAVDAAMDALSGMTSQPCLGSIVAALRGTDRDPVSTWTPSARSPSTGRPCAVQYTAFESDLKAPASEVYLHEMPGGQFTNLKEQARALGLANRWHEVAKTYAEVNRCSATSSR